MAFSRRSTGALVLVIAALALAAWLASRGSPRDAAPPAPPTVASAPESPPQPLELQLGALEPGAYDLVAVTQGGSCAVLRGVRLVAGERLDALEVAVRPGGRLRVLYFGSADSAPIRIEREGVCIVWGLVSRGEPRDWFVPEGNIRVRRMDDHTTRDVSVAAGELTEARLD